MPERAMRDTWIGWQEGDGPDRVWCRCGAITEIRVGEIRRCWGECGRWFGRSNEQFVWVAWQREPCCLSRHDSCLATNDIRIAA